MNPSTASHFSPYSHHLNFQTLTMLLITFTVGKTTSDSSKKALLKYKTMNSPRVCLNMVRLATTRFKSNLKDKVKRILEAQRISVSIP